MTTIITHVHRRVEGGVAVIDKEGRWNKHALKTAFERMSLASELFGKRSGRDVSLCSVSFMACPATFSPLHLSAISPSSVLSHATRGTSGVEG
jgi:hypothetical protein